MSSTSTSLILVLLLLLFAQLPLAVWSQEEQQPLEPPPPHSGGLGWFRDEAPPPSSVISPSGGGGGSSPRPAAAFAAPTQRLYEAAPAPQFVDRLNQQYKPPNPPVWSPPPTQYPGPEPPPPTGQFSNWPPPAPRGGAEQNPYQAPAQRPDEAVPGGYQQQGSGNVPAQHPPLSFRSPSGQFSPVSGSSQLTLPSAPQGIAYYLPNQSPAPSPNANYGEYTSPQAGGSRRPPVLLIGNFPPNANGQGGGGGYSAGGAPPSASPTFPYIPTSTQQPLVSRYSPPNGPTVGPEYGAATSPPAPPSVRPEEYGSPPSPRKGGGSTPPETPYTSETPQPHQPPSPPAPPPSLSKPPPRPLPLPSPPPPEEKEEQSPPPSIPKANIFTQAPKSSPTPPPPHPQPPGEQPGYEGGPTTTSPSPPPAPTPRMPGKPPGLEQPKVPGEQPPQQPPKVPAHPPAPEQPRVPTGQPPKTPAPPPNVPEQPYAPSQPTPPQVPGQPPRFPGQPPPSPQVPGQSPPPPHFPTLVPPPERPTIRGPPPPSAGQPPRSEFTRPPFIPGRSYTPPRTEYTAPPPSSQEEYTPPQPSQPSPSPPPPPPTPSRPPVSTSPPERMVPNRMRGKAKVICEETGIDFGFSPLFPFTGQIFAHDRKRVPSCVRTFNQAWNINVSFSYAECGIKNTGNESSQHTQFHLQIIVMFEQPDKTTSIQSFITQCGQQKINYNKQTIPKRIEEALEELRLVPTKLEQKAPIPEAQMKVVTDVEHHKPGDGVETMEVTVGQPLRVEFSLQPESDAYGFHVRNCVVKDMVSGAEHQVIDDKGCSTDMNIFAHPHYDTYHDVTRVHWHAFKLPDHTQLSIKCHIEICTEIADESGMNSCAAIPTPPYCPEVITSPSNSILSDATNGNLVKRHIHSTQETALVQSVHADLCFGSVHPNTSIAKNSNKTKLEADYCATEQYYKDRQKHLQEIDENKEHGPPSASICLSRLWTNIAPGFCAGLLAISAFVNFVAVVLLHRRRRSHQDQPSHAPWNPSTTDQNSRPETRSLENVGSGFRFVGGSSLPVATFK